MDGGVNGQRHHKRGVFRYLQTHLSSNRIGELLVFKGLVSPGDLRRALKFQKQNNLPLGEIFLQHEFISRRQLASVLMRQTMLRWAAASLLMLAAATSIGIKKAKADIMDVPGRLVLSKSAKSASFKKLSSYPGLFGSDEKQSTNLSAFTKWSDMFNRFSRQLQSESSAQVINGLKLELAHYDGLSIKDMADKVNTFMNQKPYIVDNNNWGKSDYWETPIEFMQKGGDCEDFAIAKYTALRMLGVPEERMRVAIVHDTVKNIPHAILIVYTDEGAYALDNQNASLVDAENSGRYRPIFSINRTAWWLHTSADATQVASR